MVTPTQRVSGKPGLLMRILTVFPLTIFPFIVYMLFSLFSGGNAADGAPGVQSRLDHTIFAVPMLSGAHWEFRIGDLILLIGLIVLSLELIKATSARTSSMMNHAASMAVFVIAMIGFFMFSSFATSVYFFLMLMALVDVVAGSMITIVSARRDFGIGDGVSQ